ncbi:MAG: glycoside hydrolase family 88 protein [Acidobacteria bacterium]|nr:glycoside hydrolase family 88 protein [Acidobacteriota bacterium]
MRLSLPLAGLLLVLAAPSLLLAQAPAADPVASTGRSDPSFSQPSLAPGVDYTLPSESEIKAVLDRIREHFERSTPYTIIDVETGAPITDFSKPRKNAGIDTRKGEFIDWTYSMGVVLSGMVQVTEVTGDARFAAYTERNFDFIFQHLPYFRAQAKEFGPQKNGYRRLIDMHELDDCGAIGAALVRAQARKKDPRYREGIDLVVEHITKRQPRLPDGTLCRPRPQPVSLWIDDAYMSIPFLAQMGAATGEQKWFDDAARQVIGMSARLFHEDAGLYDHSWFENALPVDPKFFWGRGAGWMLMSMADLLSVMPENHPDRAKVLEQYRRAVAGVGAVQGGTGLWHQLLDRTDSYLETSASAMFTFAIARGVNRGWLSTAWAPVAQTGWQAVARRVRSDGQIEGICVGTTAAYDAVYYYNRPTDLGAMQGYGATLMAGAEVMTMLRTFDVEKKLNTFHWRVKKPVAKP